MAIRAREFDLQFPVRVPAANHVVRSQEKNIAWAGRKVQKDTPLRHEKTFALLAYKGIAFEYESIVFDKVYTVFCIPVMQLGSLLDDKSSFWTRFIRGFDILTRVMDPRTAMFFPGRRGLVP